MKALLLAAAFTTCGRPPCPAAPGWDRSMVVAACGAPELVRDEDTRSWWTYPDVEVEFEGSAVRAVRR